MEILVSISAVIIAAAGVLLTLQQWKANKSRLISEETFRTLDMLNRTDTRLARFRIGEVLDKAKSLENGFSELDDEQHSLLSSVAASWGYVGLMGERSKIETGLVLELWGEVIQSNWKRLTPYREYLQARFGSNVGHWIYFKRLTELAKQTNNSTS